MAFLAGRMALVGGDEFRPGCEEMDRAILRASGVDRPRLLVLPTAAARQNPSKAASNGVSHFAALGAEASALMALDAGDANDAGLLAPVVEADVVYLTGGDPRHLLEALEGSLLLGMLRDALGRGAVVAGSSAGAMVLGEWMRYGGWRRALAVVPGVVVLPHHEGRDPEEVGAGSLVLRAALGDSAGHRRRDGLPGRPRRLGGGGLGGRRGVRGRRLAPLRLRRDDSVGGVSRMRLEGKAALVTGGGSGIGRATALLFAQEGAGVVVSDLREEDALATVSAVREAGGQAEAVFGDVSKSGEALGMVRAAVRAYGRLDALVNSAGVSARNAMAEGADPEEVWDRVLDVNLKGSYLVSLARRPGDGADGRRLHHPPVVHHRSGGLPLRDGGRLQPLRALQGRRRAADAEHGRGPGGPGRPRELHLPRIRRHQPDAVADGGPGAAGEAGGASPDGSAGPPGGGRPGGAVPGLGRVVLRHGGAAGGGRGLHGAVAGLPWVSRPASHPPPTAPPPAQRHRGASRAGGSRTAPTSWLPSSAMRSYFQRRTVKRLSSSIRSGSVPLWARIPGMILLRTPMPRASR